MYNILIIIYDYSGVNTYINELSEYLSKRKNVTLFQVFLKYSKTKEFNIQTNENITRLYIPDKISNNFNKVYYKRSAQLVYSQFQTLRNLIIHVNMSEQYSFANELKRLFHCHIVFTSHYLHSSYSFHQKFANNNSSNAELSKEVNIYQKNMLELADHVICVTKFAQHVISNLFKIPISKISVIYNGTSCSCNSQGNTQQIKMKYGFSTNDRILLYVGQLEYMKGIDNLIEAFLLIKDKFSNVRLVIAGPGKYDSYLLLAQSCTGRIHFTGKLDKTSLCDFYKFSEIGILPSRNEQCSYVAIEMMLHHLPTILSDIPGLDELTIHKETGLLCLTEPSINSSNTLEVNVASLASQIEYLLINKSEAFLMADSAQLKAIKQFSRKLMGMETLKVYKKILENARKK